MSVGRPVWRQWFTALVMAAVAVVTPTPQAGATIGDNAINGTYTAVSDGQWAKMNEIYHDEATITSRWTITTSCPSAYECTGQVVSDQGWTADLIYKRPMWFVVRTLTDWIPCPDGTTAPGQQIYKFFPEPFDATKFTGWDATTGPSGACGVNRPLYIELPFKLTPA